MKFQDLPLSRWIKSQLDQMGLKTVTPIQQHCIQPTLEGRNVIGVARTGSGKTLAFALPILHELGRDPYGVFALILTPTRELASQIADQFSLIGKAIDVRVQTVVGGRDMVRQGHDLHSRSCAHIVVSTPGRLLDHLEADENRLVPSDVVDNASLNRNKLAVQLRNVKFLVLDEADRLLDSSFDGQLKSIFALIPPAGERQTLLYTATMSDAIAYVQDNVLASESKKPYFFNETAECSDSEKLNSNQLTSPMLDQRYILTPVECRDSYLVNLLQSLFNRMTRDEIINSALIDEHNDILPPCRSVIVFVKTCRMCSVISRLLTSMDLANVCLHSDKTQSQRLSALVKFKSSQSRILVATDVASRGLDLPAVDVVVNHHVPRSGAQYIHRVGRTARAGRSGRSFTLVTPHEVELIKAVERTTRVRMTKADSRLVADQSVAQLMAQVGVKRREIELKLDQEDITERRSLRRKKKDLLYAAKRAAQRVADENYCQSHQSENT